MAAKNYFFHTVLLVSVGFAIIDCRPALGENEDQASEYEPSRVAEADKTTHFIGLNDVLTSDEKISLDIETQTNGRFFLLKKDSELTDLPENFLAELASTGSCSRQVEVLNRCLTDSKASGIASISTEKVSKPLQPSNEKCTNDIIALEECIIENNRYHPCAPPNRDLTHFKTLFEKRSRDFADRLKLMKYELIESPQTFEFGTVAGFEIVNYDDEYENHLKKFLEQVEEVKLPQPYLSFKNDFAEFQSRFSSSSKKLNDFKKAVKSSACKKDITDLNETLGRLETLKKKLKKQYSGPKEDFEKVSESMKSFFEKFPQQVQESCSDIKIQQSHVENKVKVLDLLDMRC